MSLLGFIFGVIAIAWGWLTWREFTPVQGASLCDVQATQHDEKAVILGKPRGENTQNRSVSVGSL